MFTFDSALGESATQAEVYDTVASRIVESVLDGFNGTIFAYGQTGSGKTHTMIGEPDPPELQGIALRAFDHIFGHIARTPSKQFLVRASFLEIYNEEIRDLLLSKPPPPPPAPGEPRRGPHGLELKEHPDSGVYVRDLSSVVVKSPEELRRLLAIGTSHRATGSTLMNERSSRSHAILTVTVEACGADEGGKDRFVAGKLHLVDLAGSERLARTGAEGSRAREAAKINLSLSALGNCISALVDGKGAQGVHVPYRDSKLTRLLQDSLGGNAKSGSAATSHAPADRTPVQNTHAGDHLPGRRGPRRDPVHAAVRQPGQADQESPADQRGSQGCHAAADAGGDQEAEGAAGFAGRVGGEGKGGERGAGRRAGGSV
ncbi:kinesin-related protein [Hyaloraphidium curvatum]|nr:kinesin-related protein [Hyaloraphidium curvatum]